MTKLIFTHDELDAAIIQMWRLRLVNGWHGTLQLKANSKELVISQFENSDNWTQGYDTIYEIREHADWSDFFDGAAGDARELRLQVDKFEGLPYGSLLEAKIENGEYVLRGQQIAKFYDELGLRVLWKTPPTKLFEKLAEMRGEIEA